MIFGFNTDIKHDDTVYHVQSEARENELTLQTQVFVRGRCIGKRALSYPKKSRKASSTIKTRNRCCAISIGWSWTRFAMESLIGSRQA